MQPLSLNENIPVDITQTRISLKAKAKAKWFNEGKRWQHVEYTHLLVFVANKYISTSCKQTTKR